MKKFEKVEKTGIISTKFSLRCTPSLIFGVITILVTKYHCFLGMLDFKGKAKWDAWSGKKGTSQDDAKTKYVEYANEMVTKHGLSS